MIFLKNRAILLSVAVLAAAGTASASETASGSISATPLGGGDFQYNIALTNTSTDGSTIGTFWFSWIQTPFEDFMEVIPTNITQPANWTVSDTHIPVNPPDGYALEFVAGAAPRGGTSPDLKAGNTDQFSFDSTEIPSQLFGDSSLYPGENELTSFVYLGAPEGDAGFEFQVTPVTVPEPVSASLMGIAGIAMLMRRRR
jgi:hypothetical protein